jgi:hypothetical protein
LHTEVSVSLNHIPSPETDVSLREALQLAVDDVFRTDAPIEERREVPPIADAVFAPPKGTIAIAIDVEFLKVAAAINCRSVAVVPFTIESSDSSSACGIVSSLPPPGVSSEPATDQIFVPAEFHVAPEVVMRRAEVLPAGHVLADLAASPDALRLFGRVLNPFTIPNPERYRHVLRRLVVETASAGSSGAADLRIDALTNEVRAGVIPFVRKVAERESLDAVLDALRDPLRVVEACDALEAFHAMSADAVATQALVGGTPRGEAARSTVAQPAMPSPHWELLPSVAALGHACHRRITEVAATAERRGQSDSVIVLAYGDGDEAPFLHALGCAAPSVRNGSVVPAGTEAAAHLGACTHVMNLHKHPKFPAAMSALGLRPVPKLIEAFAALTDVSGAAGDEARSFAALTLGVSGNHNALWDAQVLALVARFVHNLDG